MLNSYHISDPKQQETLSMSPFNVWDGPDGQAWVEFYRNRGAYVLRFPGLADFSISSDGCSCMCRPALGSDKESLDQLFRNLVQPLMWNQQGRMVFHASCVEFGGKAIAFVGASGMGKSTLATAFSIGGMPFLTDDGLLVEPSTDGFLAYPNEPSIRLWENSCSELLSSGVTKAPSVSFTAKSRIYAAPDLPHCPEPRPLAAAFFLENNGVNEISIRTLSAARAHFSWVKSSFLLDIESHNALTENLNRVGDIMMSIPSFALDYPRDYNDLDNLRAVIVDHVQSRELVE